MGEQKDSKFDHIDTDNEKEIIDAELTNRFYYLLTDKPQLRYHPDKADTLGEAAKCSDEIILIWEKVNGHLISMDKMLDRDGDAKRNDVMVETGFHEAEPTVVQIAKQVAIYGEPKLINYARYDTRWRIGAKKMFFHEVVIEYSDVADEILRLARGIDSNYKDMSLAEIGRSLITAKKQANV